MTKSARRTGIKGLHHNAYRCRDSEETRRFYEDFLGLPLAITLEIGETKTGRACQALHTFYELDDGSYLAFFEVPDMPFEFKAHHDYDLHIALEVDHGDLLSMKEKGAARGLEVRGVSDHHFIDSTHALFSASTPVAWRLVYAAAADAVLHSNLAPCQVRWYSRP